ncbi:hypothetical protein Py04_0166 [Pyrococcus sp. ST04]|nr:hypothetical protein Py04_0166 [Pyrococcus sp. ST04]
MRIEDVLKSFYPGENVLIKYKPDSSPELLFYILTRLGKDIVVTDIMDTLSEYCKRLKVVGADICEKLRVVKVGGFRKVGEVYEKMEIDKYTLDVEAYSDLIGKEVINVVLGLHKLTSILTGEEVLNLVGSISSLIGEKKGVTFYFVNEDFMNRRGGGVELWNEIATSIVEWKRVGKRLIFHIVKSANPSIEDITLGTTALEVLQAQYRGNKILE